MKIIKKILSLLYMWYWMIPIRLGAVAFFGYFGIMYMIYGSLQPSEIESFLESNGWSMFTGFFLPFGIPVFLSLGALFGAAGPSNAPTPTALEQAIAYRNGQMSISSDKKAAEIFQNTAHLDVMHANRDIPVMGSAVRGFDAKYGASSPTTVFNDMMKK